MGDPQKYQARCLLEYALVIGSIAAISAGTSFAVAAVNRVCSAEAGGRTAARGTDCTQGTARSAAAGNCASLVERLVNAMSADSARDRRINVGAIRGIRGNKNISVAYVRTVDGDGRHARNRDLCVCDYAAPALHGGVRSEGCRKRAVYENALPG